MSYGTTLAPLELTLSFEDLADLADPPSRAERLKRRLPRIRPRMRARRLDLLLVSVLVVVGGIAHFVGMDNSPARFDDEGSYTAYAWAVQHLHELNHYTYWYAHPPLGWIQTAAWTWLTHGFQRASYAIAAMREFMLVCKIASIALLYGLGLRLGLRRVTSVAAVLLFSLSPLAVYFQRAALLDNIVTPWLLGAFFAAASPRRSLRGAVASAACFAVAVLSKETALLFLPALLLLLWQHTDRRNRRFSLTCFFSSLVLIGLLYPLYALVKDELFPGSGHVSLLWAIQWQLFDRQGSGSIFDPSSTAHAVVRSWVNTDPWLPALALGAAPVALLYRRTRAVAVAFCIQAGELLRSGYLPYPFVVAMIPFAALTAAGAFDALWSWVRLQPMPQVPHPRQAAVTSRYQHARPSGYDLLWHEVVWKARSAGSWLGSRAQSVRGKLRLAGFVLVRGGVILGCTVLVTHMAGPWRLGLGDLWHHDRDAGKAAALAWLRGNVSKNDRLVVDDSFWVDLVTSGYERDKVIWFTKLDVDSAIKLPTPNKWSHINYVVLDYQDDMSVHTTLDGESTSATIAQFPTLGRALRYSRVVASFGSGLDKVTIRRVDPDLALRTKSGNPGA